MRIGIDLMGSDTSPHILFNAVLDAAESFTPSDSLIVIATSPIVDQLRSFLLSKQNHNFASITFVIAEDSITMDDEPLGAVRRKKGASLIIGMRMLKKRQIDAFVSCGNTGALIASATLSIPRLPGVARPALLAMLPTQKGTVSVLDVGGNMSCRAHNLVQFAYLGVAFQRAVKGIPVPSVGLLNVGAESKKGTKEVRQSYELLKAHCQELEIAGVVPYMNFVGNVEGRDVFNGAVDVLITDGFTGNVLLKSAEGVASLIFESLMKISIQDSPNAFKQAFHDLHKQFNYAEYPGAIVCGIEGIVIKAHGHASAKALCSSILGAANFVRNRIVANIKQQLLV